MCRVLPQLPACWLLPDFSHPHPREKSLRRIAFIFVFMQTDLFFLYATLLTSGNLVKAARRTTSSNAQTSSLFFIAPHHLAAITTKFCCQIFTDQATHDLCSLTLLITSWIIPEEQSSTCFQRALHP